MAIENKKNPRNDWKIGEKAYFEETWSGLVQAAIIESIDTHETGFPYATLKCTDGSYGTTCRPLNALFDSEQDCLDALESESEDKIKQYESEINTVEDLIKFAWNHTIALCEEYSDYDARTAYKNRANAILGIKLKP